MRRKIALSSAAACFWLASLMGYPAPVRAQQESGDFELQTQFDGPGRRFERRDDRDAIDRAQRAGIMAHRVKSVEVRGRWARGIDPPLHPGDVLSNELILGGMEKLRDRIERETYAGFGGRVLGQVGVLYIEVNYDTAPGSAPGMDDVGVVFRPYYVQVSLDQIGHNVLPIPRSAVPTFYSNVPPALRALNPAAIASSDRAFGPGLGAQIDADLLNLDGVTASPSGAARHLDLFLSGLKSTSEEYYRAASQVRYSQVDRGAFLNEITASLGYDGAILPLGQGRSNDQGVSADIGTTIDFHRNRRLSLDLGYDRFSRNIGPIDTGLKETTNGLRTRVLFEAIPRPVFGFLRAALWNDNGWTFHDGSYHRLAARIGYAKEIPLGGDDTLGLEILGGAGRTSGATPSSQLFFGGNSQVQFLYDRASSSALLHMPDGPIIRSFGERQAFVQRSAGGGIGGTAYWHANLNLAFPIGRLSRPLIPNDETELENDDGSPVTIKQILRSQIDRTGPNMLATTLEKQGLSPAEAEARTAEVFDDIKPATTFIIDYAALYSVKPLVMLDVAQLFGGNGAPDRLWVAAGAGIQFTVVTAKLEAGYMHTVSGPTFGHNGNFFARLVFQNLF